MSVGTEGSGPNPRTYSRTEYAALEAENARLNDLISAARRVTGAVIEERDAALAQLAQLAAVKGQEAVAIGHVALGSHTGVVFYSHLPQLPDGAKLYALPPASPDVEGLVKALSTFVALGVVPGGWEELDTAIQEADTALSTWRQAQGADR